MFTAEQRSGKDDEGNIWFEVFRNGKTTENSYNVKDKNTAIAIHKTLFNY
jgi:hypothetical protein